MSGYIDLSHDRLAQPHHRQVAWVASGKHAFSVRNTHVKEGNYLLQLIRPTDATIEHGNCLI